MSTENNEQMSRKKDGVLQEQKQGSFSKTITEILLAQELNPLRKMIVVNTGVKGK